MESGIIMLSTYPDKETAVRAARDLVRARLAACVTLSKTRSIYWWDGKMEESREYLAIFKTVKRKAKELREAITRSHPYEVPEVVEIGMNRVSKSYLKWMVESVTA